ncbi:MAG: stage II sporulation protein D [Clostridia bacterium]|nr:stage II sporulation protein D [Clostridia bacterium]
MKNLIVLTLILFLIMVFFPLITLVKTDENNVTATSVHTEKQSTSGTITDNEDPASSETVSLLVSSTGKLTEMTAEEYVYGAVCAEMPASFHKEALKAQAVASYTYMKWLKENSDNPPADITDNPSVHQAYLTEKELREKWGSSYGIYSEKVKEAVSEVMYEYLVYDSETAMTVFHGLSPGRTASSSDVWKNDITYLRSVTAPGDKLSPDITTDVILSKEDFAKAFSGADAKDADSIYKNIKTNEDGFVAELTYKNQTLSPTDLRSAYNLKSPFFKAENKKDGIHLTVYGKGHGVGMSQNSADYMARQGSTYEEILAHFYIGTELKRK